MRAIALISLPVVIITTLLVFYFSNRSFVGEMGIAVGIIAVALFLFLTVGLYLGVRLEKPILEDPNKPFGSVDFDVGDAVGVAMVMPTPDLKLDVPDIGGSGDDLVGCLVSIVLWIVIAVVLMILFWVLVQVLAFALPWVLLALYWIFYRALHLVFVKSDVCHKNLLKSVEYGLLYTGLYTGWLFLLLGLLAFIRTLSAG